MRDSRKTKFYLSLQIKHSSNGMLVYQSTYIEKVLKHFHMEKSYPLNSQIVMCSLEVKKDSFCPKKDNEKILGPQAYYLSAISALMYLFNYA